MVFLGKYSYGLYVYHHFLSFYFDVHRTDLTLAGWIGSHSVAVGVQATLGAMASLLLAYLSYELCEKHFLRLKQGFTADDRPCAAHRPGSLAPVVEECSPGTDADWAAAPSANGEPRPPKG